MLKTHLFRKINLNKFHRRLVSNEDSVKGFNDIPGPRGPLGLGNLFQYVPWIGRYSFDALHEAGMDKYQRWGPIVRETMVPGTDVVWLYDPNDIATVLNDNTPGSYPQRRSHLALLKYRLDKPQVYKTGGLLPTNGPDWWKLRAEVQKGLSAPQNVRAFLPATDAITKNFVDGLTSGSIADFLPEISRLNLELVCLLVFGVHLNSFSPEEKLPNSRTSLLIHAAEETNSAILPTDQGFQLWRLFNTPAYNRIKNSQAYLESVASTLVAEKVSFYQETQESEADTKTRSLLDEYFSNPALDLQDIVGMACDLLLAGVHTTAYTTAFALFNLGLNPDIQDQLFAESVRILPKWKDEITTKILNSEVPYARAILKENMRLHPISIGVGRILNKDTVLQGFLVPKSTVVVTQNYISCRLAKYFPDPEMFVPDRWLNRDDKKLINPYLVLPFGHGIRSCIARRLAEQNMLILMLRLVRKYKIKWEGTPCLDVVTKLINQPDQRINISLTAR